MIMDQIAFYADTDAHAEQIKEQLGLADAEWVKDTVTARSVFGPTEGINVAELQFNYDLGIELEILRYVSGPNWHSGNPLSIACGVFDKPFISHFGIHLGDDEDFPEMKHCKLAQETFTQSHTAKFLTDPKERGFGRKYHYRIFEMSPGTYIKYIKRINPPK